MKRGCDLFLACILIILVLPLCSASLGITPAKKVVNFQPNLEVTYNFRVVTDNPDSIIELYTEGELSEYVELDKYELFGGGSFSATLKLPNNIETPGRHIILIGAKEKVDEEVYAIGTSIAIRAPIYIDVPYPGRYLELIFKGNNANAGEPVKFYLKVINKGKEDVSITPEIQIYSEENKLETLQFTTRDLASQDSIELKKTLDTSTYRPGVYNAVAIVDYGNVVKAEEEFRLGSLFVQILNSSEEVLIGEISKFEIEIESQWNNMIDNIYADISILKGPSKVVEFRTSPEDLEPWEKKSLIGFFDSGNLTEGNYRANITLSYEGETSNKLVEVKFVKRNLTTTFIIIAIVTIIIIIAGLLLIRYYKNGKRKIKK